jgi:hypothetical protein
MAGKETRTITVAADRSKTGLPPGEYAFCEMFCNERGCDCRRVFFYVMASFRKRCEAVIAWGWESPEFYMNWFHDDDPQIIADLMGPCLNIGSPQSELAVPILDLARSVLLKDEAYVERIKRHYQLFRASIDGKSVAASRSRKRVRNKIRKARKRKRRA